MFCAYFFLIVFFIKGSLLYNIVLVSAVYQNELALGTHMSPGEGNGNPLQYSCLENPMDRGPLQATVYRMAESDPT